jgi:hypothetical protein
MLQTEDKPVRFRFVRMLSETEDDEAAAALARRAVFDVAPEVREAAVMALRDRPTASYREVLMQALRYPWPAAADHAAEALAALDERAAVGPLVALLDAPDPTAPFRDAGEWARAELVQINHLGNCLLCHAPSTDKDDRLRGFAPRRGQPLTAPYYGQTEGDFVRADITYLKQDFSVMQEVKEPDGWPYLQRFDYLVRTRRLSGEEVAALPPRADDGKAPTYPQREAVLFALRELTGADPGDSAADWRAFLKQPKADPGP